MVESQAVDGFKPVVSLSEAGWSWLRDRDDPDQRKREAPAEQTAEPEAQARRPPGAGALARAFA